MGPGHPKQDGWVEHGSEPVRPEVSQVDLAQPAGDDGMTGERDHRFPTTWERCQEGDPTVDRRKPAISRSMKQIEQRMHPATLSPSDGPKVSTAPNPYPEMDLPALGVVDRLRIHSVYPSVETRDGMVSSGMEEGMSEGYQRLDVILAGD